MKGVRFERKGEVVLVSLSHDNFPHLGRRVLFDLVRLRKEVAEEALKKSIDPFFLWACFSDAYRKFTREIAIKN